MIKSFWWFNHVISKARVLSFWMTMVDLFSSAQRFRSHGYLRLPTSSITSVSRKQVVFFSTGWRKGHHEVMIMSLCRLLANDRKVTRWAKTACVSCSGKAGTKWLRYFAVLRKVDPIDNHTLELKITVKGCERYPKRVVQKHLAQRDAKVDMGNI